MEDASEQNRDPYREGAEPVRRCALCEKPTLGDRCRRCGRDLCVLHLSEPKSRCEACEDNYHRRCKTVRYWLIGALASVPALAFWTNEILRHYADPRYGMGAKTMGLPELLVGIVGTVVLSSGFVLGLRMWLLRRRFLAERFAEARPSKSQQATFPFGAEVPIAPRSAPDKAAELVVTRRSLCAARPAGRGPFQLSAQPAGPFLSAFARRKVDIWSRTYYGGGSDPNNHR